MSTAGTAGTGMDERGCRLLIFLGLSVRLNLSCTKWNREYFNRSRKTPHDAATAISSNSTRFSFHNYTITY